MLSGGWTVQDEVLLTGLDAHLANIGEEDEGFEGFHTPIYSALLSFFLTMDLRQPTKKPKRRWFYDSGCVV